MTCCAIAVVSTDTVKPSLRCKRRLPKNCRRNSRHSLQFAIKEHTEFLSILTLQQIRNRKHKAHPVLGRVARHALNQSPRPVTVHPRLHMRPPHLNSGFHNPLRQPQTHVHQLPPRNRNIKRKSHPRSAHIHQHPRQNPVRVRGLDRQARRTETRRLTPLIYHRLIRQLHQKPLILKRTQSSVNRALQQNPPLERIALAAQLIAHLQNPRLVHTQVHQPLRCRLDPPRKQASILDPLNTDPIPSNVR